MTARRLSTVLVCAGAAGAALVPSLASAAPPTYSAPFRTAVRQLPVAPEDNTGSSRSLWGQWVDADRDCHNTRQEVLIAEGTDVRFSASSGGCTVAAGSWRSFFDGRTYRSPTELQIDHFVPVAEAWGSGARTWTPTRRAAYYNDLGVPYALNAMPSALNQSKQASGPEQWMPPVNRCRYVEIWASLKHRWRLSVDPAERSALVRHADTCPNTPLTVPLA